MAIQFSLGKNERLKSRKQIERLFSEGGKFSLPPFRVHYLYDVLINSPLQVGVGVSNKSFKKAVDRNRIKRLTREAYRLQKHPLQKKLEEQKKQLHVFLIYTGRKLPEYRELFDEMSKILVKLFKLMPPATGQ